MRGYKQFIMQYNKYVVFTPEGTDKPAIRRLYKKADGQYCIRFNNKDVVIKEEELYW